MKRVCFMLPHERICKSLLSCVCRRDVALPDSHRLEQQTHKEAVIVIRNVTDAFTAPFLIKLIILSLFDFDCSESGFQTKILKNYLTVMERDLFTFLHDSAVSRCDEDEDRAGPSRAQHEEDKGTGCGLEAPVAPVSIGGVSVEDYKYLGVHTDINYANLSWFLPPTTIIDLTTEG